jgi:formylglycine-generating enzyme required for sulfatase activity
MSKSACAIFLLCSVSLLAQSEVKSTDYTETVKAKTGEEVSFTMVAVPGGEFLMGSPDKEPGRKEDEEPQHSVRLSPFYLSSTEITLELFSIFYRETMTEKKDQPDDPLAAGVDAITGPTPIYGDLSMGMDPDHPAVGMSWLTTFTFTKWLSKRTGKKYRLATEAEWEYACRAGTTNVFGATGLEDGLGNVAWWDDNSDGMPQSVAAKEPNAWGLYDMSGNVREWVHDFYNPKAYSEQSSSNPVENPEGPDSGRVHVARGGDYNSFPEELRCSSRAFQMPDWRDLDPQIPKSKWWLPFMDIIGFRVARSAE